MWATHRAKRVLAVLVFLLVCCWVDRAGAQQESPAASAAKSSGNAADQNASGAAGKVQPAPQAGQQRVVQQQNGEEAAPAFGGFQTRVLKEGEKVPERKEPDYEDWSKPELTPGMHMDAVPLGKYDGDGFTREILEVQWRDMDAIDLWVIRPTGVQKPPAILYLYSYNGSNERYKNDDFCKFLTKDGLAAMGFVSAVTEQRFHDRPRRQTFVSELQEALGSTVHDVQMILNYLEKRGDFDMQRVGMWGDGSGASIAILAAAVDSRIKVLDLLDPWGDWTNWVAKSSLIPEDRRPLFLTSQFLGQLDDLEPLKSLPQLSTRKVRLQYVRDGIKVTPLIVMEKMEAAAPSNAEIVNYNDAKQFVSDVASKGTGFDWIKQNVARGASGENDTSDKKASLTPGNTAH